MSETTKTAAAEDKEKAAPAPAPSSDPAPVTNSKGEEPAAEAFRVSPAHPRVEGHGPGVRGSGQEDSLGGQGGRTLGLRQQQEEHGRCWPCLAAALGAEGSGSCCSTRSDVGLLQGMHTLPLGQDILFESAGLGIVLPTPQLRGWVLPPGHRGPGEPHEEGGSPAQGGPRCGKGDGDSTERPG